MADNPERNSPLPPLLPFFFPFFFLSVFGFGFFRYYGFRISDFPLPPPFPPHARQASHLKLTHHASPFGEMGLSLLNRCRSAKAGQEQAALFHVRGQRRGAEVFFSPFFPPFFLLFMRVQRARALRKATCGMTPRRGRCLRFSLPPLIPFFSPQNFIESTNCGPRRGRIDATKTPSSRTLSPLPSLTSRPTAAEMDRTGVCIQQQGRESLSPGPRSLFFSLPLFFFFFFFLLRGRLSIRWSGADACGFYLTKGRRRDAENGVSSLFLFFFFFPFFFWGSVSRRDKRLRRHAIAALVNAM